MKIIDVVPGAKIYQEEQFSILFGCPPEIIKYFIKHRLPFPDYVVLPDTLHFRGTVQHATEFVLYYHLFVLQNYFKGKRLNILGEQEHVNNNKELLRLSLLGPKWEEYEALGEKSLYAELYKESRALSLKDKSAHEVSIDNLVNICPFTDGKLETEQFILEHCDNNIYMVNGEAIDVNFSEEQEPFYDLKNDFVPLHPSQFGIDVLGGGSGFSATKPCSGLVLSYNTDLMLIDCVPYLEHSLNARGISRNQIKSIFLSHIHDDHCNILPLILFHEKVKFLCTKEIFWMACKKLSLMTRHNIEDIASYFDFIELEPYKSNQFYGIDITPHYTVHSIPCIGATFRRKCNGITRSIVFAGDNKALSDIESMVSKGIVTEEKHQNIYNLYHDPHELFIADGGMGILHGDPRDSLLSKASRVVFVHMEALPDEFDATFSTAIHGKRFNLQEGNDGNLVVAAMHVINDHYPNISKEWLNTLLNNMTILKYNTGDVIMKQGELSNGNTYLILSGNVDVLYHDGKQYERQAINQAGDLVGEMAIINQVKHRNASLVARTPVILGEIHGDLLFAFLSSEQRVDAIQEMFKKREILMRIFRNYGLSLIGAQRVAWAAKRIHPKKDAPFIPQGDTRDNFYIMLSGEYSVQKSGCEVTRLGARDMFGELGCFVDEIRSVSVKTLQDGDVLRLPKKEIASTIKSIPSLYFFARQQIKDKGGDFLGVSGQ